MSIMEKNLTPSVHLHKSGCLS